MSPSVGARCTIIVCVNRIIASHRAKSQRSRLHTRKRSAAEVHDTSWEEKWVIAADEIFERVMGSKLRAMFGSDI